MPELPLWSPGRRFASAPPNRTHVRNGGSLTGGSACFVTGWLSRPAGLTCQLTGSATLPRTVDDRRALPPTDPPDPDQPDDETTPAAVDGADASGADAIDLSSLSIAGITKRRVGWVCAALAAAWIVAIFARQASEGAAVAGRADQVARDNAALEAEVAALERELQLIKRPAYIAQQARGLRPRRPRRDPVHARPLGPEPGTGRSRVRVDAGRCRRGARDAPRVLAVAPLRSRRLGRIRRPRPPRDTSRQSGVNRASGRAPCVVCFGTGSEPDGAVAPRSGQAV